MYGPTERSVSQSLVFAPRNAAAVAWAATQGGWVGYLGDLNAEEQSTGIILAMLQKGTSSWPAAAAAAGAPTEQSSAAAESAAAAAGSGEGRARACRVCRVSADGDVVLMRCSRCRSKADMYCSRACQKADWGRHKQGCQPVSAQDRNSES